MSLNISNCLSMASFKDSLLGNDVNTKTSFLYDLENVVEDVYSGNLDVDSGGIPDNTNQEYLHYFNDVQSDVINNNSRDNAKAYSPDNAASFIPKILSEEEERKLVLESVKDVNCDDFPFDEVLSLEDTVNKEKANKSKSKSNVNSYQATSSSILGTRKRGNRPPLLKCQTWSHSEFPDDVAKTESKVNDKLSLDSPSFYNTSSIDFSAISHLSEEHDKIMAQEKRLSENVKQAQVNAIFHSASKTKPQRRTVKVSKYSTEAFKSTHKVFDLSQLNLSSQKNDQSKNGRSFSLSTEVDSYKTQQTLPKEGYTVHSHSNNISHQTSNLQKRSQSSNNLLQTNSKSSAKNLLQMSMEKQPLPPEGFKITRYPLQSSMVQSSKSLLQEVDTIDKNTCSQADLLQIILKLRKRLEWTEEKLERAENEVQEYKEIAMKTVNPTKLSKAQAKKPKKMGMYNGTLPPNNILTSQTPRRWSDDAISTVSSQQMTPSLRKRVTSNENHQNTDTILLKRRKTTENVERGLNNVIQHQPETVQNLKNKGLLDWLSTTTNDTEDMEIMSMLQNPNDKSQVAVSKVQQTFSSTRSMSHDEVRMALRAKVGGQKSLTTDKNTVHKPKLDNIQEHCDLEQQMCPGNLQAEFPTLAENADAMFSKSTYTEKFSKPNASNEIFHSLSDSELHNASRNDKNTNTTKHISAESLPNIASFDDLKCLTSKKDQIKENDIFSQLDSILEL